MWTNNWLSWIYSRIDFLSQNFINLTPSGGSQFLMIFQAANIENKSIRV